MTAAPIPDQAVGRSLTGEAMQRLVKNRAARASVVVLALIALACIVGPWLTGHDYDRVYQDYVRVAPALAAHPSAAAAREQAARIAARMRAKASEVGIERGIARLVLTAERPIEVRQLTAFERSDMFLSARVLERSEDGRRVTIEAPLERRRFLLGTDQNGRDLLTRTLVAGRISLAIGLLATVVALVIGVTYGAVAGYLGGRVDALMMRFVDVLYALPFIFLVILLVVVLGRHFVLMLIAVGAVEWLDMARIVRGQTRSIRTQEYVAAAEALGVGTPAILARHIVPNLMGPVIVMMTLLVPRVILLESFLSFLGLGVQEPMTSWGVLIAEGARNIEAATWMLAAPAAFLVATLLALNFLGDGLRDALDPRDR